MKQEYIETGNTQKFFEICSELVSPASMIGPSLAMVTGHTGRGKTETAKQYAVNSDAIYIPPMNIRSPAMVLREITFELANLRPTRSDTCLALIGDEMAKRRRLIIIDEADLLDMKCLEMLRNVNERFACPVMLIGEEELKGRVGSRRRLAGRIRQRMEFAPINQFDIAHFLKMSLGVKASADITAVLARHAAGDWSPVLTATLAIERAMKASGINDITMEIVNGICKH